MIYDIMIPLWILCFAITTAGIMMMAVFIWCAIKDAWFSWSHMSTRKQRRVALGVFVLVLLFLTGFYPTWF